MGQVVGADAFKELAVAAWQSAGHPSSTEEPLGSGFGRGVLKFEAAIHVATIIAAPNITAPLLLKPPTSGILRILAHS